MQSTHRRAFTLIELLVVIAIIAILAAILFPVFAQAKEAAKKTQSISNAKQLLLASQMYLDDFDDTYHMIRAKQANPDPLNWAYGAEDALATYTKSTGVFASPGDPYVRDDCGTPFGYKVSYSWTHYRSDDIRGFGLHAYNATTWTDAQMRSSIKASMVGQPSATINLYELWTTPSYGNGYAYYRYYTDQVGVASLGIPTYPKALSMNWCGTGDGRMSVGAYGGNSVWGFADGHAKTMKREQTMVQHQWTATDVTTNAKNLFHYDEKYKQ